MIGGARVVDMHVHGPGLVPQPFAAAYRAGYRLVSRDPMPAAEGFEVLSRAGVDVVVAKAVGDPVVTRWHRGRSWDAVDKQLCDLERRLRSAGVEPGEGAVLGVEGGDPLTSGEHVDRWHARGVRVVTIVHLSDNALGTTCMPWQQFVGRWVPVRRRRDSGLTALGRAVVRRMQQLGMLVDLAHCDRQTLLDAVEVAEAPVASTHTGARALQPEFPRFLSDDELRAIASTGGVIGLWPYLSRGRGVRDMAELVAHARHIAALVGVDHLCLGTDMNGVPGTAAGYRGEQDVAVIAGALGRGGFEPAEVAAVMGANAARVLGL
ncbi:MAG: dipeptidase [Actinobacteria bacterium]|nr:MAG: dipeptidase [Actinomycetota bacterium]